MFEVATSTAHREAQARAHAERGAVFREIFSWIGSAFTASPKAAPVASATA